MTVDNVVEVTQNLSGLVMMATESDQNQDNLRNVSSLLNKTANLFSNPTIIVTLSPEEVAMVKLIIKETIIQTTFTLLDN